MLINRNLNWEHVLKAIEDKGKTKITDSEEFFDKIEVPLNAAATKRIKDQQMIYMQQLKSYLSTYTTGELHAIIEKRKSKKAVPCTTIVKRKANVSFAMTAAGRNALRNIAKHAACVET